jgi:phenylalanyl-tRNA synthetase beta chain
MKFSFAWLQEHVSGKIELNQLVEQLTSAGLEVSSVEPVAAEFNNVVVAEIIEVIPHPDAEKLKVCQVAIGNNEYVTIVTNVSNVEPGMKVPAALVGALLPGDFRIKKAKLRGVESQGMFCGVETLELGDPEPGLLQLPGDAPVGSNIREYLNLDDHIIDVELTPNRGDCLSILGFARETAIANQCDVKFSKIKNIEALNDKKLDVKVEQQQACPRYLTRVISNINIKTATPIWMVEKLRRSGVRSINPVVDVTNYVMLELGQPMHAFDLDKIDGTLQVRFFNKNEKLKLLNDQELSLDDDVLAISDDKKPLAMAGIMGGLDSSVTGATTSIVLESAFFDPAIIMGKARRYGLHTDSSHRFERGVDPNLPIFGIMRATDLILQILGGEPGPVVELVAEALLPRQLPITLAYENVKSLLGCEISKNKIEMIFNQLGMQVAVKDKVWQVVPPSHRFDIKYAADLVEEVARLYGYDNIPGRVPKAHLKIQASQPNYRFANLLQARDYHEAVCFSFVNPKLQQLLTPNHAGAALKNPISPELSVMRTTLWSSLIQIAQHNLNRQQQRIRFFEVGLRFVPNGAQIQQIQTLAGVIAGNVANEQWAETARTVDFYDIKADVQALLSLTNQHFDFETVDNPALHPGRSAKILCNQTQVGLLGALHPEIQQQLNLPTMYLFELDLDTLNDLAKQFRYQAVSKFPAIRRDIAVLVSDKIPASKIYDSIIKVAGNLLNSLIIFDIYKGDGVISGHISLALGLTWQAADRTLSDNEISVLMQKVLGTLKDEHKATLRE